GLARNNNEPKGDRARQKADQSKTRRIDCGLLQRQPAEQRIARECNHRQQRKDDNSHSATLITWLRTRNNILHSSGSTESHPTKFDCSLRRWSGDTLRSQTEHRARSARALLRKTRDESTVGPFGTRGRARCACSLFTHSAGPAEESGFDARVRSL